eukprot:15473949-Alexandrium_andersonii.AAC.1
MPSAGGGPRPGRGRTRDAGRRTEEQGALSRVRGRASRQAPGRAVPSAQAHFPHPPAPAQPQP